MTIKTRSSQDTRDGKNRHLESGILTEQAKGKGVTDSKRPFIQSIKGIGV